MRFGVIADTHGYLDPRVLNVFTGVDRILLAGDIGGIHIVDGLRRVAPVTAVRGNNDVNNDCAALPDVEQLEVEGTRIRLSHYRDLALPGADIAVFGHSHRPEWREVGGTWLLNPGAAGRRGFHRDRSVALLEVAAGALPRVEPITLGPRSQRQDPLP